MRRASMEIRVSSWHIMPTSRRRGSRAGFCTRSFTDKDRNPIRFLATGTDGFLCLVCIIDRHLLFHTAQVGTPGQLLSVIVDTGSSRTAFPCSDCENCGSHMDPPFSPSASSTFRWVGCGDSGCSSCLNNSCSYTAKYVEGSSIEGKYFKDVLHLGVSERALSQHVNGSLTRIQGFEVRHLPAWGLGKVKVASMCTKHVFQGTMVPCVYGYETLPKSFPPFEQHKHQFIEGK